MKEMAKLTHNNYQKITNNLWKLAPNWIMRFNVVLNRNNNKSHDPVNFHTEIQYYKDYTNLVNIKLDYEYYISIEQEVKPADATIKTVIQITVQDIMYIKLYFSRAAEWFTKPEYASLFVRKGENIIMVQPPAPIKIDGLKYGSYIEIEPSVNRCASYEDTIGVRIYINSDKDSFFINNLEFLSLVDFINQINMPMMAMLMITYVGRPAYGTNLIQYGQAAGPVKTDRSSFLKP